VFGQNRLTVPVSLYWSYIPQQKLRVDAAPFGLLWMLHFPSSFIPRLVAWLDFADL
jgi:hypothetical protein